MVSLAKELEAAGYAGDRSTFLDLLVITYRNAPPRWTVDELTLNPTYSRAYCQKVRRDAKSPRLYDDIILRALANLRKRGGLLSGEKGRRCPTPIKVDAELEMAGYFYGQARFFDEIVDLMFANCPCWNDEELLFHPAEAADLCEQVRRKTRTPKLADNIILRVLVNGRKRGDWGRRRRSA